MQSYQGGTRAQPAPQGRPGTPSLLRVLNDRAALDLLLGGEMLTRAQIVEMIRVFMPATSNEARLLDRIDEHIGKAEQLGFLRPAKNGDQVTTKVLLKGIVVIATTPGAGTGAATAVQAGPGNLDFLLAVSDQEALKIVNAQAAQHALYFSLAATGKGTE